MAGRKKKQKKNGADTEMGYCPFEHKAGLGAWAHGAHGRGARRSKARGKLAHGRWAMGRWVRGTTRAHRAGRRALGSRQGRGGRTAGARGARGMGDVRGLGVLLGQQAVHSVHSACFDPISTQYCS